MKEWKLKIQQFQNKNKTKNTKDKSNFHTIDQQKYTNLRHHVFNNNIKVNNNSQHFNNTKIEELNDFKNSSDYEAMWETAIVNGHAIGTSTEND